MARTTVMMGARAVGDNNPFAVQQAQLTDENDEVRANEYVMRAGLWVPRVLANLSAPHQNTTLASNAVSNIVTTTQAGGGAFTVHEFTLFSTIAGIYSLFNGTPSGTTNLLARLGLAANSQFTFNYQGLIAVSAGNHLVLRNDTASQASIVTQTQIATA